MQKLTRKEFIDLRAAAEAMPPIYTLVILTRILTEMGGHVDFYTSRIMTETGKINYLLQELEKFVVEDVNDDF